MARKVTPIASVRSIAGLRRYKLGASPAEPRTRQFIGRIIEAGRL